MQPDLTLQLSLRRLALWTWLWVLTGDAGDGRSVVLAGDTALSRRGALTAAREAMIQHRGGGEMPDFDTLSEQGLQREMAQVQDQRQRPRPPRRPT